MTAPTTFKRRHLDQFGARLLIAHLEDDPVGLQQLREHLITEQGFDPEQVLLADAVARVYSMTYISPTLREKAREVLTGILNRLAQ